MWHRFHEKFQPLLGVLEMGGPKINQVTDHFGKTSMVLDGFGMVLGLCLFRATIVLMRSASQFAGTIVLKTTVVCSLWR